MWRASRPWRRGLPSGAALIEAIVALTILAFAGVWTAALVIQSARAVEQARAADVEAGAASAFFDAVALWTRADLDRHLGTRAQGHWRMRVDRPVPALYEVTLTDSTGAREILRTSLFRPEPRHAAP